MSNTMFFNLLLNIGLLVLIATMLTKLPMVRSMLLEDSHAMGSIRFTSCSLDISRLNTMQGRLFRTAT